MKRMILCASIITIFCLEGITDSHIEHAKELMQKKQPRLALVFLEKAQQKSPENIELLLLLATAHYLLRNYKKSGSYYEKALIKNPDHINTRYNCASVYSKCGEFDKALNYYEKVYEQLQSEGARGALLKMYLRLQKWVDVSHILNSKLWWYDTNIYGKTIFLDLDKPGNGYGDSIQFLRYGKLLHQAGAKVIVRVPKALELLFGNCPYLDQVITTDTPVPTYDITHTICIASLLLKSQEQISMKSPQVPYLFVNKELINFWKKKLSHDTNFKIGVCWKSTLVQNTFNLEITESPRSITLDELAPIAKDGISFYSLQKFEEAAPSPFPLIQFTEDFDESHGRFIDTAALMMNMDLIISVDTSIVHLAGALGKKTWLLLSCESDYRWFTKSSSSPLYSDVTLFRQKEYGNWKPVIAQLQQDLSRLIKEST